MQSPQFAGSLQRGLGNNYSSLRPRLKAECAAAPAIFMSFSPINLRWRRMRKHHTKLALVGKLFISEPNYEIFLASGKRSYLRSVSYFSLIRGPVYKGNEKGFSGNTLSHEGIPLEDRTNQISPPRSLVRRGLAATICYEVVCDNYCLIRFDCEETARQLPSLCFTKRSVHSYSPL